MDRKKSKTRDFGSSTREAHDASPFYDSKIYQNFQIDEKREIIDNSSQISNNLFTLSEQLSLVHLKAIPSNSIHFIIIQFPLCEQNILVNRISFISQIQCFFNEISRILITGGRLICLLENLIQTPPNSVKFFPFHAMITRELINLSFIMRGDIILEKDQIIDSSLDHNSAINFRNTHLHGLVFSKTIIKRMKRFPKLNMDPKTDTISRDQFLESTKSVWRYNPDLYLESGLIPQSALEDYILRFINLYSFKEDTCIGIFPFSESNLHKIIQESRVRFKFFIWDKIMDEKMKKVPPQFNKD